MVDIINSINDEQLHNDLYRCCGCRSWVETMSSLRPFESIDEIIIQSSRIWWLLDESEWLEAFSAHPRIGDRKISHSTEKSWESKEQQGVETALSDVLNRLSVLNDQYYDKFHFVFLICATGKSAEQMLKELEKRLMNSRMQEIQNAAIEQEKIVHLRIHKLINSYIDIHNSTTTSTTSKELAVAKL